MPEWHNRKYHPGLVDEHTCASNKINVTKLLHLFGRN